MTLSEGGGLMRALRAIAIVAAFIAGLALFLVVLRYDAARAAAALVNGAFGS